MLIEDEQDLTSYGLNAKAIHIPGHSKASIGILTTNNNLICGDLLTNIKQPEKNTLVDNQGELDTSIEKVTSLGINTVYPGHGKPFPMKQFIQRAPKDGQSGNCQELKVTVQTKSSRLFPP